LNARLEFVHATAIVIGEAGILIRGEAGAGKSTLALTLIEAARQAGRFAALVADDRVGLAQRSGRLIAYAPELARGVAEFRGLGLVSVPFEARAVVRLIVDIGPPPPQGDRLPEAFPHATALGVDVPWLWTDRAQGAATAAARVLAALGVLARRAIALEDSP